LKVLVIGATGGTGKIAVRLLLDAGHEVTALARAPDAFTERHGRLSVIKGEARDADSLARAARGQDAVLSAFGPRALGKDDLQEVFMKNLVTGMQTAGVKRLANLSAWGTSPDSWDTFPFYGKLFVKTLLRHLFADKLRGEVTLMESDLDFVNVRPGPLGNGRPRGPLKATLDGKGMSPLPPVSRADLAAFMVNALTDDTWLRKSPVVAY
jgi:uncharacterized protein YbjT (DUF2867 family)